MVDVNSVLHDEELQNLRVSQNEELENACARDPLAVDTQSSSFALENQSLVKDEKFNLTMLSTSLNDSGDSDCMVVSAYYVEDFQEESK